MIVDSGRNPGICLYVFCGECLEGEPEPSIEGAAEWVAFEALGVLPVVEDLPILLGRIQAMERGDVPFPHPGVLQVGKRKFLRVK